MKLSDINPNPNNPRLIKDDRFKNLVKSIEEFPKMMKLRPIIVDNNMVILGGNMRYKALRELKFKEIPDEWIKKASELTEEEMRRFIIADNIQHGDWDMDILNNDWDTEEMLDWGLEIPEFKKQFEVEEDDYEIPDEIETDIKLGDIFQIGKHRLMCGDSTKRDDVERLMNGDKANMVFTDPPYNVGYGSKNPRYTAHVSGKHKPILNDKQDTESWIAFNTKLASVFHLICMGDIYVWGAPGPDGMRQRLTFIDNKIHWSATIIWKKNQLVLAAGKYQRLYEPCFYGWISKSSFVGDRKQVELWEYDRPRVSDLHPTMKPIGLCGRGISNSSKEGNIVLDIFGGSGSTMVSCHQLNRNCYMMELDPEYCQVIIDRMKNLDPEIEITNG